MLVSATPPATAQRRLGTETPTLLSLIQDINKGEIKIPKFQRSYVWTPDQALDLLDSLARAYPVGSLLFWRTHDKLPVERNIGEFALPTTDDITPVNYVLDGQQRLTVIYSCLGARPGDPGFEAGFDLLDEKFLELPQSPPTHVFPLRWLTDTTKYLNFRTALQAHPKSALLQGRFDLLYGAFKDYSIPVVTLKDMSVEEVCPIFERINSSGTRLSTYDLMVAATWSTSFDLNDETASIQTELANKDYDAIDGDAILKCLAATQYGSVKKDDILALRRIDKGKMDELVDRTRLSICRSVDCLSTEFSVYSWDFLPYEAFLVLLVRVFSATDRLTPQQVARLRVWFWRAAFNERYRVGGEAFLSNDFNKVCAYVIDGRGQATQFGGTPTADVFTTTRFRSNNSRSRALVLALATLKPRNITNGLAIDIAGALAQFNRREFHHIHPKAWLKKEDPEKDPDLLANICMLARGENNAVSDSNPIEYIPALAAELGEEATAVFRSNGLPDPGEFDYERSSYDDFVSARSQVLVDLVRGLCSEPAALGAAPSSRPVSR